MTKDIEECKKESCSDYNKGNCFRNINDPCAFMTETVDNRKATVEAIRKKSYRTHKTEEVPK